LLARTLSRYDEGLLMLLRENSKNYKKSGKKDDALITIK
jgi:hypothetical protein